MALTLCYMPHWKASVSTTCKSAFSVFGEESKEDLQITCSGDPGLSLAHVPPKESSAIIIPGDPFTSQGLAWSLRLSQELPDLHLLFSALFSLLGKNIPNPEGHETPAYPSMSMFKFLLVGSLSIFLFTPGCSHGNLSFRPLSFFK